MTRDEMLAEVERKRLMEQVLQQRAAREEEPEPEMGLLDTARGAIQSVNRGSLLGFGDEIVGAGRALGEKVFGGGAYDFGKGVSTETQSLGDAYEMYREDERDVTRQFEKEHGKTALALNLLGGVASPLNKIAPGFGTGGKAKQASQAAARATAEGGLAGIGESTGGSLEELGRDALAGAGMGLGISTALRGTGKILSKTLAKQRVDEDLVDAAGQRKPLQLTDSALGDVYRKVGRIWGAQGPLKAQEQPFVDAAARRLAGAQKSVDKAGDILDVESATKRAAIQDTTEEATDVIRAQAATKADEATTVGQGLANSRNERFMRRAASESLPQHAQGALEGVNLNRGHQVVDRISNWWTKNGFREVKDRWFDFDDTLKNNIRSRFKDDPDLRLALGDIVPQLKKMQGRLTDAPTPGTDLVPEDYIEAMLSGKHQISGDALMAMRNVFATGANGASRNGSSLRQVANVFDTFIRKQLPKADVVKFDDQIKKYTTSLTYADLMRKKAVNKRGGVFTGDEWLQAAAKYGGRGHSLKRPPLRAGAAVTARKADEAVAAGKTAAKEARANVAPSLRSINRNKRKLNTGLNQSVKEQKRQLAERRATGDLGQARDAVRELSTKTLPENTSLLSDMLSTGVAGGALGGRGRGGNLLRGYGVGRAIASGTTQDLLAGQTKKQKALAKALREGDYATINRILSRFGAQQTVGE